MGQNRKKSDFEKIDSQVIKLTDFVRYQNGAVVSRTLVNKKTGTVTLFAFDQGQALSEHTAPYDALVYLLDGKAEITIGGKPFSLSQAEMIIMPAGIPHALKAIEKFKMVLVLIKSW